MSSRRSHRDKQPAPAPLAAPGGPGAGLAKRVRWNYQAIGLALILLATCAAYWPARNGEQIWDDDGHITKPELRSWQGLVKIWLKPGATQQYYPLLHSAFWLEHKLWGDNVLGYHVLNVALHLVSVMLLYLILRRLKIPGALLAAAIFALHPVMVESVAWISEQKNTLSAAFYFAAMLAYLEFDDSRSFKYYWLALALFVCGLLTKTVTATLPAALLVIFWWQRGALSLKKDVIYLMPFFVLGAFGGIVTAWIERKLIGAEGADFELSFIQRGLLAGRALWFYLAKLVWPFDLIFSYPRWEIDPAVWWQWLFPIAALAVFIALWAVRRRTRAPLAGWLLFVGTLVPVLGFLNVYPFIFSYVADHFQYLASVAIFVLMAAGITLGIARLPDWARWAGIAATLLLLIALGTLSRRQSGMYADRIVLYETTIARNPDSWLARNNLGSTLQQYGQCEAAAAQFREGLRIRPDCAEAHSNLGYALANLGKFPAAFEEHRKALELRPNNPNFLMNYSIALIAAGRASEAVGKLQAALERAPDEPILHNTLGVAFNQLGRYPEAKDQLECALELYPQYPEAHQNLGTVLAYTGHLSEAIEEIQRSLEINPNSLNAHINLGIFFASQGNMKDAMAHFERALQLAPQRVDIHNKYGDALRQAGRISQAIEQYETAIRLQPNFLPSYGNLARTLAAANRPPEAIATAEKAIQVAHSIGLEPEATKIQDWLNQYRSGLQLAPGAQAPAQLLENK